MSVSKLASNKIIFPATSLIYFIFLAAFGWWASAYPQFLISAAIILLVLLIFLIKFISSLTFSDWQLYKQLIAPIIFLSSSLLFYVFFNTLLLQKIFWFLVCLVLYFYVYNLWLFYQHPAKYQAFTLENFSWYLHLAGGWFFTSAIYGFIIFINFKIYFAIFLLLLFASLIFWQMWWIQKLEHKYKWWWYLTYILVCFETFVTLSVLPLSFYLLGFWWSIIWFLTVSLIFQTIKETLSIKKYLLQVIIILSLAILLTLTAKIF